MGFRVFGLRAVDGANVEPACLSSAPMIAVFLGSGLGVQDSGI